MREGGRDRGGETGGGKRGKPVENEGDKKRDRDREGGGGGREREIDREGE